MANDLPNPQFGRHLIEELTSDDMGGCIIYTQKVPWKLYGSKLTLAPIKTVMIEENSLESLNVLLNYTVDFDTAVAFGGGLVIDAAKYVAWKTGKRFVAIPTAISADVSVCRAVAVREDWKVRYVGDKMPEKLVIDFDVIQCKRRSKSVPPGGRINIVPL
jgi:glycerol-1-phosphate dehydrogenase [NAD(P)+]